MTVATKHSTSQELNFAENRDNFEVFVRYANKQAEQEPKLKPITESIPQGGQFASPIYYVNKKDSKIQYELPNPYAVSKTNVAKKLQDNAEKEGTVFYPVYVESDANVGLETQIEWLKEFCRDYLNTTPQACKWFYSGNRSIHVHVPKLATEHNIDILRDLSQGFEHDIDSQIYTRKRQFRLPGVDHSKTGLPKVEIQPDWSHDEIIRESATAEVEPPKSFKDVLTDTFGSDVLDNPQRYLWQPERDSETIQAALNDWEKYETCRGRLHEKWKAHYSHPVSPYAHAGGNRSLVIAKIQDGTFSEKRETHQEGREQEQIFNFMPSLVFQFWGCNRQFTVDDEYRPVKISKTDYEKFSKMDIGEQDCFALIGGKSRNSKIFSIPRWLALELGDQQTYTEAITLLEKFGYDTGSSDKVESNYDNSSSDNYTQTENTTAYELQQQAEQEGIETLSHIDLRNVANRLLQQYGIDDTRRWFKKQFGDDYDKRIVDNQIKHLCESFDDLPQYSENKNNVEKKVI